MSMGSAGEIPLIGDWLKLHFVLNEGMAFGFALGSAYGKLILSLFRLVAIIIIGFTFTRLLRNDYSKILFWSIAAILGGAVGNLIDSVFYGVLLENAPYSAFTPWFHGQVIDMIYVDIWEGIIPNQWPIIGGKNMALLPIFNLADAAIIGGMLSLLIFQKRIFRGSSKSGKQSESGGRGWKLEVGSWRSEARG